MAEPGPEGCPGPPAPRLAQALVQAPLQLLHEPQSTGVPVSEGGEHLDPDHHVEVAVAVLLHHVPHIVRLTSLE